MKAFQLIGALRVMRLVTYLDVAASTFFVLDYLLTFRQELQYVWKRSKWSTIHILFVIQRYLPFLDTIFLVIYHQTGASMTVDSCKFAYYMSALSMTVGIGVGEVILALRTWAVWNRRKRVGIALAILFVAIWGVMFFVIEGFLRSMAFGTAPYPGFRGCLVIRANHSMIIVWCLLMVLDTIIFGFMIIPGMKDCKGIYLFYFVWKGSELVKVIYRDGLIYYIYLCALSTINIVVVRTLPYSYQHLLTSTERAFHSVISSRVLLDIRATLDAPQILTALVAEGCETDTEDPATIMPSFARCVSSRRSRQEIELHARISNAQAEGQGHRDDEYIPGGRVTPLPPK